MKARDLPFLAMLLVLLGGTESALAQTTSQTAAFSAETEGDVVTISGVMNGWQDRENLWRHIRRKRVLILRQVSAESVESAIMLGKVVRQAKLITVLDGDCGATCLPLFIGGEQRQWGKRAGDAPPVAILANPPSGPATLGNSAYYAFYSEQFFDIPASVLDHYINRGTATNGVRFVAASEAQPDGVGMECQNLALPAQCQVNPSLLPLQIGLFTSADPYPLAARAQ